MAIDTNALEAEARFLMGGLPESILSSTTMQIIIQKGITKYSDDDSDYCNVLYYTIIESLRYLIREQIVDGASKGTTGGVTSIREEEGPAEIEIKYSEGNSSYSTTWQTMLDDFLQNPQQVCEELTNTKGKGSVIIGDGDKDGFTASYESRSRWDKSAYEVKRNSSNRNQTWPWRPNNK